MKTKYKQFFIDAYKNCQTNSYFSLRGYVNYAYWKINFNHLKYIFSNKLY